MVAEELFFGEAGTGPAGDLQAATQAAAQMVGSLGMAGSLISYDAMQMQGAANVVAKVLSSDETRESVDRILNDAKKAVRTMLDEHRHVVEALRDALVDRDELIGDEIVTVIETAIDAHDEAEQIVAQPLAIEPVNVELANAEPAGPATINLSTDG
jgi:ATP-dependent Zn protease